MIILDPTLKIVLLVPITVQCMYEFCTDELQRKNIETPPADNSVARRTIKTSRKTETPTYDADYDVDDGDDKRRYNLYRELS